MLGCNASPAKWLVITLAATTTTAGCLALFHPAAEAQPGYKKQFDTLYMRKGTALHTAYDGRNSCNVCHIGGTDRRQFLNDYGMELAVLLDENDGKNLTFRVKKKNRPLYDKTVKKVQAALKKAAEMPSDFENPASITFGELIRTGKLPISPKSLPGDVTELPVRQIMRNLRRMLHREPWSLVGVFTTTVGHLSVPANRARQDEAFRTAVFLASKFDVPPADVALLLNEMTQDNIIAHARRWYRLSTSTDPFERQRALRAFVRVGDVNTLGLILRHDQSRPVRIAAARGLEKIGKDDAAAVPVLGAVLTDEKADLALRHVCCRALKKIKAGDKAWTKALDGLERSLIQLRHKQVTEMLKTMADQQRALRKKTRASAIKALGRK